MDKQQLCQAIQTCAAEYLRKHPKETPFRIWSKHTNQPLAVWLRDYINSVISDNAVTDREIITEVQMRASQLSFGELRRSIGAVLIQCFSESDVRNAKVQAIAMIFERENDDVNIVGDLLTQNSVSLAVL